MLLGMFSTKTVNLQEIALAWPGQAKIRHLQRFREFLDPHTTKIERKVVSERGLM
jgi:hypothetical protein